MKSLEIHQYQSVRILPLSYQRKATDGQVTSYDPDSADFNRIAEKSCEGEPGYQYGPEFIVECDGEIVSLFCGDKAGRRAAKYLYNYLPLNAASIAAMGLTDDDVKPHGPAYTILTRLGDKLHVSPAAHQGEAAKVAA